MSFRAFFLSLTIVAILIFSVFGTTTVYADEGTTTESAEETSTPDAEENVTPEVTTEESQQPEEEGNATAVETPQPEEGDATAVDTPQPEEGDATAVETPQPEEGNTVVVETPQNAPEPLLEQLPDNTTVTVINSEGEVEPLVTQESADAIASDYDPIWCPDGQSPIPGENGCTESFSSFDELLSFLLTNELDPVYQQAGTIYIQQGQYLGGESSVDFNNYNFNSVNNYDLTLQGGWDTTANPVYTNTQFEVPITIGSSTNPWVGSLTFNNIAISGLFNQTGLTAYSESNITLSNVDVSDSQAGAELSAGGDVSIEASSFNDNDDAGAVINAGGKVEVEDSDFDGNGGIYHPGFGLKIDSGGDVSLQQVSASNNEKFGADIIANGKVSVGGNSVFSGNVEYRYYCYTCSYKHAIGGYGLKVVSLSDIEIDGITADKNYFFGADLDGANVQVRNGTFNDNRTGRRANSIGYGLMVKSDGALGVTLKNISANNNERFGANVEASGKVDVMNSFFNGNKSITFDNSGITFHGYGLQVLTTKNISLNTVTAVENHLLGARLDGGVISIFKGTFNNNDSGKFLNGRGLEIVSTSSVALASVEANKNQFFGANIVAVGDVSIASSSFNCNKVTTSCNDDDEVGSVASAGGYGLQIVTGGSIELADVEAIDNYLYGASLTGSNVTIANGVFSTNGSGLENYAVGYGLKIVSTGKVTIDDITANGNQLYGADILAKGSVLISTGFFNGHQAYTFIRGGGKRGVTYYGYGLQVFTADDITMDGIEANFNNLWGANLDALDVFILDSKFNNNVTQSAIFIDDTGLLVNSLGNVTLINVETKENRLIGATITATGNVNISGSNFSGNQGFTCSNQLCNRVTYNGYGLKVVTPGNIFLGDVTADYNNLFGANLTGSSVTIFDSTFDNNGSGDSKDLTGKGLEVVSTGDVTLINVSASYNELFGANIQSDDGNVTISASIFNGNQSYTYSCKGNTGQGYGLKVVTPGNINLVPGGANGAATTANDNGAEGAILDGNNVTVVNSSFTDNGATGLTITANIAVSSNVTASNNSVDGAKICAAVASVFGSKFENNDRYGLNVGSPQFIDVLDINGDSTNTYIGNGAAGLFYNPTCLIGG
jgi:hypothetical protein